MDPDKIFQSILEQWSDRVPDPELFTEQVNSLQKEWLDKGGYMPNLGIASPMYDKPLVEMVLYAAHSYIEARKKGGTTERYIKL